MSLGSGTTRCLNGFITAARRHGKDPLELIKSILLKAGDIPLTVLYNPGIRPKTNASCPGLNQLNGYADKPADQCVGRSISVMFMA